MALNLDIIIIIIELYTNTAPYGRNFRGSGGRSEQCSEKAWVNKKSLSPAFKNRQRVATQKCLWQQVPDRRCWKPEITAYGNTRSRKKLTRHAFWWLWWWYMIFQFSNSCWILHKFLQLYKNVGNVSFSSSQKLIIPWFAVIVCLESHIPMSTTL